MRVLAFTKSTALLAVIVLTTGLMMVASGASAAPVTINLCAVPGTATLTGAVTTQIWGFGIPTTPGDCTTATAGLPGPVLSVTQGDVVTMNVSNALPPAPPNASHTIRFEIPGIGFDAGPIDAPVGAILTRTFTASAPGTYVYQSAGDAGRQTAMGLYGALIVRPTAAAQAYGSATTAYDVEATLVLSAVDPSFNTAPDGFDLHTYRATYWLINGQAYPDTAPGIVATSGQRVLLRYLNAGYDNTTMTLLGLHQRVLARDARVLNNPFDAVAETIPAGATEDTIATIPSTAAPSTNGFALYNRQLHLTNAPCAPNATCGPGGMLTFIHP